MDNARISEDEENPECEDNDGVDAAAADAAAVHVYAIII